MNEIEKMMQNANVKKQWNSTPYGGVEEYYPPFTAEKQFEILKIIVHSHGFNSLDKPIWDKGWDIAIARLVNFYWEVLTTKEQQQVKGILE
jgi:hypothetical protein